MKRVFIFGAGFSKPSGMPLATELLPLLMQKLEDGEIRQWLDDLHARLEWLSHDVPQAHPFQLNIEEVFHHANFDIEALRLKQHLATVGRYDGPDTPWNRADEIARLLSQLQETLCDVILEQEGNATLAPIMRWAEAVGSNDTVVTFNYDTLVERSLTTIGKTWHHGTGRDGDRGIAICKLHGSIDWIVASRDASPNNLDLLFDKLNTNRSRGNTGHAEDDNRLWRCRGRDQLMKWLESRDLQSGPWKKVGIAGLGSYKPLHRIPGLGNIWTHGMQALLAAEHVVVVGFAMSDFDKMAQMQFAGVARQRDSDKRPIRVTVIDPHIGDAGKARFRRVFRSVEFVESCHEKIDWGHL